ncbi:MAG: hypothetical protein K0Q76_3663 [Panacagrimonas sp.]|nr:TorF family putative porin [Panacagrimonas sp.]MCC2658555.1 hypothetical protein [Panacagrimonas sp.]
MNRYGRWTAGLGLCGATLLSPAALATTTAHVGVFSEYVFRGITANGGAAVQGGIDYVHDSGLLAGVWATNANNFGGSEFDIYAGYLHKFSDTVMADIGVLYYYLSEDEEGEVLDFDGDGDADIHDLDTFEFFTTLFAGPFKFQVYYSPDYLKLDEEALYYTGTYTHKINDTINVALQAGYTHGDAPEYVYGDDYIDYSIMLNKTVREGLVFSLGFIDTNLSDTDRVLQGTDDDPKVMVSAKQTFPF